ncbi:MAG TPA: hypothetical protein VLF66_03960, partial [Thermoanaerobaculia bacterium]|nr:hypothetical protein [Thermoanaerobaculia bacterium]
MRRPVYFVKYWEKTSVAVGAEQMVPALRSLGVEAHSIHARELPGVRGSILVFIKRANILHLAAAWARGNRCVLDVQDQVVFRHWISHWPFYHAFIFRNRRQEKDAGLQIRIMGNLWARFRTIYQQWDPRHVPNRVAEGELRVGYVGSRRSIPFWDEVPGVEFVGPERWIERAPDLNAHVSIRRPGREWRYKPGAKVATAAACGAVLLTTRDCSSVELLGEDYPFYTRGPEREDVVEAVARAREELGGPAWREALERMREVRERTSLERVA